jgi:hypothetical protein
MSVLEFVPPPIITAIRKRLEGIRILAPTGVLGTVPEEKLDEALAAGAAGYFHGAHRLRREARAEEASAAAPAQVAVEAARAMMLLDPKIVDALADLIRVVTWVIAVLVFGIFLRACV